MLSRLSYRVRAFVVIAAGFVVIWPLIAFLAARLLIVSAPLPRVDTIAVLSGSRAYKERTRHAAALFKEGRGQRILLTNDNQRGGWSNDEQRNPFYYELATAELQHAGVPRDRIHVIPDAVSDTYEEVVQLRRYGEYNRVDSMLVVTSSYHSRRAWWILRRVFNGAGLEIGIEAVPPGFQVPGPSTWWLYSQGWMSVPPEYLKMAYYWLRIG